MDKGTYGERGIQNCHKGSKRPWSTLEENTLKNAKFRETKKEYNPRD